MRRAATAFAVLLGLSLPAGCERSKPSADSPSPAREATSVPTSSSSVEAAARATAVAPPIGATPPSTASAPGKIAMPSTEALRALASGSNAFAFDLWARLRKRATTNAVVSPASISFAFAMAYVGAKGETAAQMKKVLRYGEEPSAVGRGWGAFGQALTDPSRPITFRIANRLFGEKTFPLDPAFVDTTRASFGAPLELLDFKTATEPSRLRINAWVEDQTEKRIRDVLPERSLTSLTRLVLVNAIYFLGSWQSPFEERLTYAAPFYARGAAKKDVPTMHQTGSFGFTSAPGVKVLELPYKGGSASLVVVLPDARDGLSAVEASLSSAKLAAWTKAAVAQSVEVSLPRFEIGAGASLLLSEELKALGMPLAFDREKADFTGIASPPDPNERVHLDEAFHKAFVKVDEKGTEAAAATALAASLGGMPPKPVELKVDHPFLFFVVDKASGLVLFMGRVTDP